MMLKRKLVWSLLILGMVVFGLAIYTYFPGNVNEDANYQLVQIQTGRISDTHPAINQIIWSILLSYGKNISVIIVFQAILALIGFYILLNLSIVSGLNDRVIVFIGLVYIFSPTTLYFIISPLKDTNFSFLIFILMGVLAKPLVLGRRFSNNDMIVVAILGSVASLVRHNGVSLLITVPLAFWIVGGGKIVGLTLKLVALMTAIIAFTFLVMYPAYGVDLRDSDYRKINIFRLHEAFGVIANKGSTKTNNKLILTNLIPENQIVNLYNCKSHNRLMWDKKFGIYDLITRKMTMEKLSEIDVATKNIVNNNYWLVVRQRICGFVGQLIPGPEYSFGGFYPKIEGELNSSSTLVRMRSNEKNWLRSYIVWTTHRHNIFRFLFWTPLLSFVLILGVSSWAWRYSKNIKVVFYYLPVLVITVCFLKWSVDTDFRYLYQMNLSIFYLPLIMKIIKNQRNGNIKIK